MRRFEKKIRGGYASAHKRQIIAFPTKLVAFNSAVDDVCLTAFSETLNALYGRVSNISTEGIPDGRTDTLVHYTVEKVVFLSVPQRIAKRKAATFDGDVSALLKRRFTVGFTGKGAIYNGGVGKIVKSTFLIEGFVFNNHFFAP